MRVPQRSQRRPHAVTAARHEPTASAASLLQVDSASASASLSRSKDSVDSLASHLSRTHLSPTTTTTATQHRKLSAPSPALHRLSASPGSSSSPPSSARSSSSTSSHPSVRPLPSSFVAGSAWRGRRRPNRLTGSGAVGSGGGGVSSASTSASLLRARGQARKKRKDSRLSDELNTPNTNASSNITTHHSLLPTAADDTADSIQARIHQLQAQLARLKVISTPVDAAPAPAATAASVEVREEWAEELDSAPFMEVTNWNFYGLENSGPSSASDSSDEDDESGDEEEDEEEEDEDGGGVVSALKKMMNFGGGGGGSSKRVEEKRAEEVENNDEEDEHQGRRERGSRQRHRRRQQQQQQQVKRTDSHSEEEKRSEDDARHNGDSAQPAEGKVSLDSDSEPVQSKQQRKREESKEDSQDERRGKPSTVVQDGGKEGESPTPEHDGDRSESEFNIASSPASSKHSARSRSRSRSHSPSASAVSSSALSSSRSSYSSSSTVSSAHSTTDRFPYERNILALQPHYLILRRLYACQDAVTYKAVARATPSADSTTHSPLVVLKISDGYSGKKDPKEVRLLTAVQGHPRICRLVGWHPLLSTECSVMVTQYIDHSEIEHTVMLSRRKQQRYLSDLLSAVAHMHSRNVLYRDIKPSNVLWSDVDEHATVIDFDVATFYSGDSRRHRSVVGTDGYLSAEILRIQAEKKRRRQERREREEAEAEAEADGEADEEEEEDGKDADGAEAEDGDDEHDDDDIEGYGFATDVYSAGVILAQLLFRVSEDDIADMDQSYNKGPAFVRRCKMRLRQVADGTRSEAQRPGLELCISMLVEDPDGRIGVSEAMQHEFFNQQWTAEDDKVGSEDEDEEVVWDEGEEEEEDDENEGAGEDEEEQDGEDGAGSDEEGSVDAPRG